MKNTKAVILQTSLDLFNAHGLSQITLRGIANKMKISQGNLNYHYKKREHIIEALYFQLVQNIDNSLSAIEKTNNPLLYMSNVSKDIMQNFYTYRFFFLDIVQIMRENEKIKAHYMLLTKQREAQFAEIFELLITHKYMRPEMVENEYKYLYKRFQIMGDFWISSAETETSELSEKSILEYAEIMRHAILPYLTAKGIKEFESIETL